VTRRVVAVLVPAPGSPADPDGVTEGLRLAMVEDVYETVAALELVEPALVVLADDPARDTVAAMAWPGTPVYELPEPDHPRESVTVRALRLLADTGAEQVTLLAGDAPDLPGLLVGKLHRALGSCEVAVLPSATGGLVAIATRCPLPDWLTDDHLDIDGDDVLATLQARAPRRTSVAVGPGWHRVRRAADLTRLDPGLEGWEVTRELLRR
jgi:hypothetical protein